VTKTKRKEADRNQEPVEKKLSERELALLSEKNKKFNQDATANDCVADLRALQEEFPLKFIGRNFYRCNGTFSDSTWNQFYGTFAEFRRQAKLELTREQHELERRIAKHAALDHYRNFYNKEVLPYHKKYVRTKEQRSRFRDIAVCSDLHDEELDPFVFGVFLDACQQKQPNVIVLNGDIFDNPEFSKYNIDPRSFGVKRRFDFVKENIFAPLRKACPKSQIDFVIGNHDWRIIKLMADKTPNLRVLLSDVMGLSLSDVFGLKDFQINLVAKIDLAAFQHSDVKDELRENYEVYYDRFACSHFKNLNLGIAGTSGHTHRPTQITFASVPMGKMTWTETGCMSRTRAEYTDGMDNALNSFLFATVDTSKIRDAVQTQHYIITGDHAVVEGQLYERKQFEDEEK